MGGASTVASPARVFLHSNKEQLLIGPNWDCDG